MNKLKEDFNSTDPPELPLTIRPVFTFSDKGEFTLSYYDKDEDQWHYLDSLPDIYDLKKYDRKGLEPVAWWDLEIPPASQITMNLISREFISQILELYFIFFWVFHKRD